MAIWRSWKRAWDLQRRLQAMEQGVRACLENPGLLPEVGRRLGISPQSLEQGVATLRTRREDAAVPSTLLPQPFSFSAPSTEAPFKNLLRTPEVSEDLSERVRRLILLLIDLPLAWRDPARTCDLVVWLAEAAVRGDLQGIERIETELARFGAAERPGVKTGPQLRASGPTPGLRGRFTVKTTQPMLVKTYREASSSITTILAEPRNNRIRPDLPLEQGRELQTMRVLLETLAGDEKARQALQRELDYLDTLRAERPAATRPQAEADLLVLVRERLKRLVFDLAEPASLTRELIEKAFQALTRPASPRLPELLWSLEQGPEIWGASRPGALPSREADVAWSLLERAAAALPMETEGGPEIEWAPAGTERLKRLTDEIRSRIREHAEILTDVYEQLLEAVQRIAKGYQPLLWLAEAQTETPPARDQAEGWSDEDLPTMGEEWLALREALAAESLASDPEFAVRLAGAVCENRGTLAWETCLALANSRARYHRYISAGDSAQWRVRIDTRAGRDGAIEIPFAVIEQPLSAQFRERFEAEDLPGRLRILWRLIAYASRLHTTVLTLTAAEARRQVELREQDLWEEGQKP